MKTDWSFRGATLEELIEAFPDNSTLKALLNKFGKDARGGLKLIKGIPDESDDDRIASELFKGRLAYDAMKEGTVEFQGKPYPVKKHKDDFFAKQELKEVLLRYKGMTPHKYEAEKVDKLITYYFDESTFEANTPEQLFELFKIERTRALRLREYTKWLLRRSRGIS